MSILNRFRRAGIHVTRVTAPPSVTAADVEALGTSTEGQLAEMRSRFDAAARAIRSALDVQSDLHAEDRNDELIDLALEVRSAMAGRTPLPVVVPGRTS